MALQSTSCKILFLILSVFVYSIVAQYNCKDFASESWRNFTINETFEGILESVFISDIEDAEIQSSAHLQASVNADKFLTISVKTNFEDHDEDIDATAKLVIDCANNDYTIDYYLNIGREACTELNFNSDYYTYAFYNGLPQDYEFDLNDFERISIKCAQNSFKFDIEENDYFDIYIADDQGSNGEYYASIKTKKDIKAPFDQIFNITAVDTEDPENVATAFLEIQISEPEEMSFADSYYWGVIYRDLKIVISNGPIALKALSDLNEIEIQILPDYGDFFDVEFSSEEVELVVSPQRKYEELNDTSVMIILKAHDPYFEYTAETIVMLNVSSEILTTIVPIVEDISTTTAPQDENNEDAGDGDNHETNDEGDEDDDSQQINDGNVDIDSQEDNKQKDDKDNDSQQNDDEDEDQKVDVDDDDDQKIDDNDEDKQIDDSDVDHDADDQKGGDDDEDQKNDGDEDDDYNDDDGLVLEGGVVNIDVPLTGLDYWIAHTRAVTVIIVVICSFIIVSSIIYLRSRTPRREIYMY